MIKEYKTTVRTIKAFYNPATKEFKKAVQEGRELGLQLYYAGETLIAMFPGNNTYPIPDKSYLVLDGEAIFVMPKDVFNLRYEASKKQKQQHILKDVEMFNENIRKLEEDEAPSKSILNKIRNVTKYKNNNEE